MHNAIITTVFNENVTTYFSSVMAKQPIEFASVKIELLSKT